MKSDWKVGLGTIGTAGISYCHSDCAVEACYRHESHAPRSHPWLSWQDFSELCAMYTKPHTDEEPQ